MTRMTLPTVLMTLAVGLAVAQPGFAQTPPPGQTPPPVQTPRPTPTPAPGQTPRPTPPPLLPAPTPVPFPTESKIGFVDMQIIVSTSKLGKAGQDRMKVLTDQQNADLGAKSKTLQALQQEIQSQGSVLTPAALAAKNSEMDKLQRAAQFAQQDWQAQADTLNKQLLQDFQEKLLPVLEGLRAEMNLWAIFSVGDSGAAAVHPGLNLSTEVIKRLDAKYPGGK
jgi:Skp family chaperone for outer membrane proteins